MKFLQREIIRQLKYYLFINKYGYMLPDLRTSAMRLHFSDDCISTSSNNLC